MANELKSAILCFIAISCLSFSFHFLLLLFPSLFYSFSILRLPLRCDASRLPLDSPRFVIKASEVESNLSRYLCEGHVGRGGKECTTGCVAMDSDTAICHAGNLAMWQQWQCSIKGNKLARRLWKRSRNWRRSWSKSRSWGWSRNYG